MLQISCPNYLTEVIAVSWLFSVGGALTGSLSPEQALRSQVLRPLTLDSGTIMMRSL